MSDVFKGWRRKVGVVTLLMASVLMAGWARSLGVCEETNYSYGEQSHAYVGSGDGLIYCGRAIADPEEHYPGEPGWFRIPPNSQSEFESSLQKFQWVGGLVGIGLGIYKNMPDEHDEIAIVMLPYWSIVIPLALLSAFLLLISPHKSTQKKITEPIPDEGK